MYHVRVYCMCSVMRVCVQDHRKAFEMYQQAGELGSMQAWRNVAAMYATGEGVPKCEQTARSIMQFVSQSEAQSESSA